MSIYIPQWDVGGSENTSTIWKCAVGFRFPTLVWFWLQKLGLKACLAGSLPLLLKKNSQEDDKYSGPLVKFQILSLNYRFVSFSKAGCKPGSGLGWNADRAQRSSGWDEQGKAGAAAAAARLVLKVTHQRLCPWWCLHVALPRARGV